MFLPHTESERQEMLALIGKKNLEDLFHDIPEKHRFPKFELPEVLTELEALQEVRSLAEANNTCDELICFLGAGAYHHYIPAAVDLILKRGDFFTAYTPYQPEISQGTLQAIFEFQSLIANLTGMEVSNASHYDGATAVAEACLAAYHHFKGKRGKIIVSPNLHPHYQQTIKTYLHSINHSRIQQFNLEEPWGSYINLLSSLDEDTALVVVQYPDLFGHLIDFTELGNAVHKNGSLLCVVVNPIALGLIKPPSEFGADFVVGEGQPLGIPLNYGGPYLGFFATKKEFIRKISGRIVGETVDTNGNRGYVLTLTAREQHIRRERATSNICTNQGLMALAATIYLSLLGKSGLRQVAEICYQRAHYAANQIDQVKGYRVRRENPFFHEFVIKCPCKVSVINQFLLENEILGGLDLSEYFTELSDHMLVVVTEMISKEEIDLFVELLSEVKYD